MTPEEYAEALMFDLAVDDMTRGRSQQTDDRKLGMSDLGGCREYVRRFLAGDPFTDTTEKLPAMLGTWVDAGIKTARAAANPDLLLDAEVSLSFGDRVIVGHPDEIDPAEPSVTDYKTVTADGLALIRRNGSPDKHRYQRHLYYAGAVKAGLVPAVGVVRNVYLDRSGKDPRPHVEQEPFDPAVISEAADWLHSVHYALEHGEESSRDTPETTCRRFCAFYTACRTRAYQGTFEPSQLDAARAYLDADTEIKRLERVREAAKDVIAGAEGELDGIKVHSTVVSPTEKRKGYVKVEVTAA